MLVMCFCSKVNYHQREFHFARSALQEYCSCFEENKEVLSEKYEDTTCWWSIYIFEESLENQYESAKTMLDYIGNISSVLFNIEFIVFYKLNL